MTSPQPLPAAIDKRNMLWAPDPRKPFDALAIGDGFLEAGRLSEALDFFERVTSEGTRQDRIAKVKKEALAVGNAFLIGRLAGKGLAPISKDEWSHVARTARASGQLRYALRAAIAAEDEALATELRTLLGDAVPQALAAAVRAEVAESPEQAHAGATHPGQKVEAVAAAGAASSHQPEATPPAPPAAPTNGTDNGAARG